MKELINFILLLTSALSAMNVPIKDSPIAQETSYFFHRRGFYSRKSADTPIPTSTPTPTVTATPKATTTATTLPAGTSTTTPLPTVKPLSGKLIWGAEFPNWEPAEIASFESQMGKPINMYATFIHWGNEKDFPSIYKPYLADKGKTLVIFWEAKDYNGPDTDQPQFSFDSMLSGKLDSYFTQFAKDAKAYGGPVIIVPFSEANDNSEPWGGQVNGNTPQKFISAFNYIRKFFTSDNVKFAWAMNNVSSPNNSANAITSYYPGDESVDYVGIDGFNFGNPWQTFDQVFRTPLNTISQYGKPIIITSMASASNGDKAGWIKDAFGTQIQKYPLVIGWIWFNEQKEQDWRINSDPSVLSALKQVLP